jgi:hypothetical protein
MLAIAIELRRPVYSLTSFKQKNSQIFNLPGYLTLVIIKDLAHTPLTEQ